YALWTWLSCFVFYSTARKTPRPDHSLNLPRKPPKQCNKKRPERLPGVFGVSVKTGGRLCRFQRVVAFVPVALAQLVRLQRIQNTQDFGHVAADFQVVHGNVADHALRI